MPSPWNTAQYTQAAPIAQKATAWGTKVSWTSAEQLADAIFPTNADDMQQSLEPFHHGLLNHKMEIETLYKTNEKLSRMVEKQQRCTSDHQTLHSANEAKHAALRSTIKETQDSAIASDTLSKNNVATLNKHAEWFETMKQQQKEQYAGLVNHRDTLRSLQESHTNLNTKTTKHEESMKKHSAKHSEFHHGLLDHKNKIEELRNTTASMQRSIKAIENRLHQQQITPQRLENLHERTQSLERNQQSFERNQQSYEHKQQLHASKINSLIDSPSSANNAMDAKIAHVQAQASSDKSAIHAIIASLQAQANNDRHVQFQQVLAPRRK
jgi:chromosome segregation ATPase